jgi:cobaltochelatase CobN
VKYVKGNFQPTRQFRDMADLNAHVRDWVPQAAGQRIHGTTRLRTPHMCLQEGKPRWQGLPDGLARRLHIYYVNGGQLNIDVFYATLSAHVAGKATSGIADPIMFPTSNIYHPDHPGLVFDSPTA